MHNALPVMSLGRPGLSRFFADAAAEAVEHRAGAERVGGTAKKAGGGVARALARTAKLKAAIMLTPPSASPVPVWRREA